ncbi:MAG: DNA polymerase III subunit chi [Herminiimonas sp.]|nr:DNA polymerase III subunit chi [Herminiimonas sp.]
MTRIDFHSNVADRIDYVCRLTRKARAADCQIVLLAQDKDQRDVLDDALWRFSELDFLPHVHAEHPLAPRTPIVLTDTDAAELPHHQVLINLSGATPAHFARFERMFEIISTNEADKAAGRERYAFYKQRGYALTHYDADKP